MTEEPTNTFVEGDNLEVLRSMAGHERVDLVYIDPPYNTGNDFAYADRFRDHAAWTAEQTPRGPARPGWSNHLADFTSASTFSWVRSSCTAILESAPDGFLSSRLMILIL